MQDENAGISLKDIFKTILTQKWLALIIAVVITVAGVLAIQLGYNKGERYYISDFSLVLPGDSKEEERYTYPDGTPFQYADIVAYKALKTVKESNEIFSSVDIDGMVKKGAVSVSRRVSETEGAIYTLTAKASFFPDNNVAKEFIIALANIPVKYLSSMNVDYGVYVSLSAAAEDYESEISFLNLQLDYLVGQFEELIEKYGGNFVVNGKTLSSYYNEIKAYSDKNNLETLLAKVKKEGILKSEESKEKYGERILDVERQYEIADFTLQNLLKGASEQGNPAYVDASVIKAQSDLVAELNKQKEEYKNYIDSGTVNPEFGTTDIKPEYDKVKGYTDALNVVVNVIYERASSVAFTNVNAVSQSGGMGMLTSVLLCLIVGAIVAGITAYAVGSKKKPEAAKPELANGGNDRNETV